MKLQTLASHVSKPKQYDCKKDNIISCVFLLVFLIRKGEIEMQDVLFKGVLDLTLTK